jgi:toxin-antitoxin system PIN domain toxin
MSELKYTKQASKAVHEVRESSGLPWLFNGDTVSGDLPDINVWLALAVEEHPHHAAAKQYWDGVQSKPAGERNLWFCRVTMLGLVRLLSQPKVMGQGVLNLVQAMALYKQFRAVAGVDLLAEPKQCDSVLQALVVAHSTNQPLPTRLWTDAYLAALAQSSGVRLVSFDQDFMRFDQTSQLILTSK